MRFTLSMLMFLSLLLLHSTIFAAQKTAELYRFGFGSCNKQNKTQDYWKNIDRTPMDLWIWLGDVVYLDKISLKDHKYEYEKISQNSYYKSLNKKVDIMGVWDDHDFGKNNADSSYQFKKESKVNFLNFLQVPLSDEVRKRDGIYHSKIYNQQDKKIEFLMLDLRTFMNHPNSRKDEKLLGSQQWLWLENRIEKSDADLIFIGTSLAFSLGLNGVGFEGWKKYEQERLRLIKLMSRSPKKFVLLSGDRHFGEVSEIKIANNKKLVEIMSSGLNNSNSFAALTPNENRISKVYKDDHFMTVDIQFFESDQVTLLITAYDAKNGKIIERMVKKI